MKDATKITPSNTEGFERVQLKGQSWFAKVMNEDFFIKNSWGTEVPGKAGDVLMFSIPRRRGNQYVQTIVPADEFERRWCRVETSIPEGAADQRNTTDALNEIPIPISTNERLTVSQAVNLRNDGFPKQIIIRKSGANDDIIDAIYELKTTPVIVGGPKLNTGKVTPKEFKDNGSKSDTGDDTAAVSETKASPKKSRRKPPAKKKVSKGKKSKK